MLRHINEGFQLAKLSNTKYADELTMKDIIENFETKTKREFYGADGFLRVGERRDRDAKLGIAAGFMKLSRRDLFLILYTLDVHLFSFVVPSSDHSLTTRFLV